MNGPILYLLSGNGSTKAWWEDCLPHFRSLSPIPLELPGYGDNPSSKYHDLQELAEALLEMTEPGQRIFAVGINALVVLHALVRRPDHFSKVYLLAPVGAFLEERKFVRRMRLPGMSQVIHFLLGRFPKLFRRKFSSRDWTPEQYARMGEGYRKCRAFGSYFKMVQGWNALDLFEWITAPVTLIWGKGDNILELEQAAAWDGILPRAAMEVIIKEDWEHYPYIDDPVEFASFMESDPRGFPAHTKAGRLRLGTLAGLPVPRQHAVRNSDEIAQVVPQLDALKTYAVRSSGASEDHIDHSNAGIHTTFLRVPVNEVAARASELLSMGLETAVIQEFVEPKVSGVAFVRWISAEVEMVEGHLEELVSGTAMPIRFVLSKMGGEWEQQPERLPQGLDLDALHAFLRQCVRAFHYTHSDIEWAWDGKAFHMLQLRPVTGSDWRRALSSANLDEILPRQVSRIMEHAQRRAALSIGRLYGLWDARTLQDNEPFTVAHLDASYINSDLFLSRFIDWGLPSQLLANEIGGAVPSFPFRPVRFIGSVPMFLRMRRLARREILKTWPQLAAFGKELEALQATWPPDANGNLPEKAADAYAGWFVRYYVFIVRQNMVINACLSTALGSFLYSARTVYGDMAQGQHLHRLKFESDPATPRTSGPAPRMEAFPRWSALVRMLHRLGMPGLGGKYFEVREWFRDNNMRLFFGLHWALRGTPWMEAYPGVREKSGAFWQDGGAVMTQSHGFVIYPGAAEGRIGMEILVVDALEPGHYEDYKQAKAVVARTGGRLSHGATLLRELRKPSAVIPGAPAFEVGGWVRYEDGKLEVLP